VSLLLEGLQLFDASLDRTVKVRAYVLYALADIRAFPYINGQMSAPAKNGACDQCWQQGTRLHPDDRTVYLGFYRYFCSSPLFLVSID
jgi:hypothetical protein